MRSLIGAPPSSKVLDASGKTAGLHHEQVALHADRLSRLRFESLRAGQTGHTGSMAGEATVTAGSDLSAVDINHYIDRDATCCFTGADLRMVLMQRIVWHIGSPSSFEIH